MSQVNPNQFIISKSVLAGTLEPHELVIRLVDLAMLDLHDVDTRPSAWQSIDSAPKDGQFLVYMPDESVDKIQAANYRPNVKVIGNHFAFDLTKPTHWQPLPPAPEQKTEETK